MKKFVRIMDFQEVALNNSTASRVLGGGRTDERTGGRNKDGSLWSDHVYDNADYELCLL